MPNAKAATAFTGRGLILVCDIFYGMCTKQVVFRFLVCDAFVRTNRRADAMMFVCLFVRLSGTGMRCDHTVHYSADLSIRLYSQMFWPP